MRTTSWLIAALWLAGSSSAHAQRRFRIGPTYSSLGLEDASGSSHSFSSFGGTLVVVTGDEGEAGVSVTRYHDLSTDNRVRRLTLYGLDSYYYPVGMRGVIAPFAATTLGLARVAESASLCLLLTCRDTVSTTSQLALGFGLGVRVNVGDAVVANIAGRFLEVPGSQIQALEAVANASVAFGAVRKGEFLEGTVGPAASFLIPISGELRARAPFIGARFRRETKKVGTLGLQIDFAPLKLTAACPPTGCEEDAILFAPGYEKSARLAWGRLYGELGFVLGGVYSQGPDRGIAQGAHGGLGVDLYGGAVMWNLNSRLLWLQRNSGDNVFGVQVGVSVSPRIGRR
ncbi:MAG: hypothetical protein DMD44_09425 [Gemmatimonadetes bacterium]|nr:MAG: hypothetical protein DMD44_09425 [Gemmatimonadota bacterium]